MASSSAKTVAAAAASHGALSSASATPAARPPPVRTPPTLPPTAGAGKANTLPAPLFSGQLYAAVTRGHRLRRRVPAPPPVPVRVELTYAVLSWLPERDNDGASPRVVYLRRGVSNVKAQSPTAPAATVTSSSGGSNTPAPSSLHGFEVVEDPAATSPRQVVFFADGPAALAEWVDRLSFWVLPWERLLADRAPAIVVAAAATAAAPRLPLGSPARAGTPAGASSPRRAAEALRLLHAAACAGATALTSDAVAALATAVPFAEPALAVAVLAARALAAGTWDGASDVRRAATAVARVGAAAADAMARVAAAPPPGGAAVGGATRGRVLSQLGAVLRRVDATAADLLRAVSATRTGGRGPVGLVRKAALRTAVQRAVEELDAADHELRGLVAAETAATVHDVRDGVAASAAAAADAADAVGTAVSAVTGEVRVGFADMRGLLAGIADATPPTDPAVACAAADAAAAAGDTARAARLYAAAADAGSVPAAAAHGRALRDGVGVVASRARAVGRFRQAADGGDAAAAAALGALLDEDGDAAGAVAAYRTAAEGGCVGAMIPLGTALAAGRGVDAPDGAAAERWLRAAADAGRPDAAVALGHLYLDDDLPTTAGGFDEAVARFAAAAAAGSGDGLEALGVCRLPWPHCGRGRVDVAEAVAHFRAGARAGHPGCTYWLGLLTARGLGLPRDGAAAHRLWLSAAEAGQPDAAAEVGTALLNGLENGLVAKDAAAGASWLRRAAEAGHRGAAREYGFCMRNGWGVAADMAGAAKWFRLAER